MAVSITDLRTVVNEADATTGWTNNVSTGTSAPVPVEATTRLGTQVSNEIQNVYFTAGTPSDLTNTLFYVWGLPGGVLDTTANGGIALILGDGTNTVSFFIAGSNVAGFRHDNGPVFWQCFVMDTGNPPANATAINGTVGALNFGSITQFGIRYKTLAKSVGGAENCFTDIMRYGSGGVRISTGTSGNPGTFLEVATADRQTGNLQAHGILRELGTGLYGVQGPLTIGDSTGTNSTWFEDTNSSVVFEDRGFATDKYHITIRGNAGTSTNVILGSRGGEGLGSDGVTLTTPPGVGSYISASDANVDQFSMYGCAVNSFNEGVVLSSDATNAPNHEIFATSFNACGRITIGLTEFKNNNIVGSVASSSVLLSDDTNVDDLSFVSAGTGHAILIEQTGTYEFRGFTYTGYASTDGSTGNEVLYNNSGGSVTINVVGGDTPTVRNGAGASTTVNNNVQVTLTNLVDNTEVRVYEANTTTEIAGIEDTTTGEFSFSAQAGSSVDIRIFAIQYEPVNILGFTVPNNDTSIPIDQTFDRNYENP